MNKLALIEFWDHLITIQILIFNKYSFENFGYIDIKFSLDHIHLFNEIIKFDISQSLCKVVCNYLIDWNIKKFDFF